MFNRLEYINQALNDVYQQIEKMSYRIVYLAVQGSTNYNLDIYTDEYMSDIDMKCFVMPTFDDLYFNIKVSKTYQTNYGQVEVKDIRLLPDLLAKMNISYLELLVTPYYKTEYDAFVTDVRNSWNPLFKERKPLMVKAMMGTCLQKRKALCHVTTGKEEKMLQYGGYDPKEVHHICRIVDMAKKLFDKNKPFDKVFYYNHADPMRQFLCDLKVLGTGNISDAERLSDEKLAQMKTYENMFWDGNKPLMPITSEVCAELENAVKTLVRLEILHEG